MDWANSFVFRFQVRERFFIQTCLNNLKNSSSLLRLRNFPNICCPSVVTSYRNASLEISYSASLGTTCSEFQSHI